MPNQNAEPNVSVIVSFYNTGEHLDGCLAQLRNLDFRGHELILIDDCSTDGTTERLLASDLAECVRVNPQNLGVTRTRQLGLELARGKYVWFADHDDEWHPAILRTLYDLAESNAADIAICAGMYINKSSGRTVGAVDRPRRVEVLDRQQAVLGLMQGEMHGYLWSKLFRRSVISRDVGEDLGRNEDLALLLLTLQHCERVATTPEVLYRHLDHPSGMTRQMHAPLEPYERCYQLGLDLAAAAGVTDRALLRHYRYFQFIGPSVGTALSRDAFSADNVALLARARKLTRWRDLPGAFIRFPLETTLAFAHKVFGLRLRGLYRVLRRVLP